MGYPQPLRPDASGLLQEETQGQGEEEEREAETHRLPPVSVRGLPRDGKEAGLRGFPALPSRVEGEEQGPGQSWGPEQEASTS